MLSSESINLNYAQELNLSQIYKLSELKPES